MVLLATNIIWLLLEYLWIDTTNAPFFNGIRVFYFGFAAIIRVDGTIQKANDVFDEVETLFSKEGIKTFKFWCYDLISWCLLIWIFGRSIM